MAITHAGTSITFNDATVQTTAWTGSAGGVTSAVAGNGVAVSAPTGAVTFSASAPSYNTVGSYVFGSMGVNLATVISSGSNYSAGSGVSQMNTSAIVCDSSTVMTGVFVSTNISGTWKWMTYGKGPGFGGDGYTLFGLAVRVA